MKLPRLPRKCDMIDAKYSPEQMREYAIKCIQHHILMNTPQITILDRYKRIEPPVQYSIIEKIKRGW